MKAIDELVQQIHKDWDGAVEERVKANTQDGWYYAEAKAVISKAHWGKAVEVQKELQDIERYLEEQVEAHKPDEDDIQNEFYRKLSLHIAPFLRIFLDLLQSLSTLHPDIN